MMCALTDNIALVEHNDLFSIFDGGNALGHDQQGAGAGMLLECLA